MSDTAGAILTQKGHVVWSVSPDDSVFQAISLMAERGVGALVVLEDGKVAGIVSERDYARKVILQGKSSKDTRVGEVMTTPVVTVGPSHSVDECLRVMTDRRIRHLPVLRGEAVVGMISIGDLVRRVIARQTETIQYLEEYISGPVVV